MVGVENKKMLLFEVKVNFTDEPLLRLVLEILTYYLLINDEYIRKYYFESLKRTFKVECNEVIPCILTSKVQYQVAHPICYELINKFGIRCFTYTSKNDSIELSSEEMNLLRNKSLEYYKKFDVKQIIIDSTDRFFPKTHN